MAEAASRMLRWSLKDAYQELDPTKTRNLLIDPGETVLRSMPEELSKQALQALHKAGVDFLQQSRVESMRPGEVVVSTPDGEQCIRAATVIWTAGVRASHLGHALEATTGCSLDRGGRVVVESDFSIASHPEIRIAGDLCSYSHTKDGQPLPGMAAPAKQAGSFIGKDIAAVVAGRPRPKFQYLDLGSMAIVDGSSAVADLRGLKFSGLIGVLLWAGVHLGLIHDMQQRVSLATKWIFSLLTRQRASMLLTGMPSQHMALNAADAHFPMRSGEGPSIASPDAALQAAMEYYSKEISGLSNTQKSNTQELIDTNEDSAADSAAAIK
jgi:NADH dehydrogenase